MKYITIFALFFLLSGCAVVPKFAKDTNESHGEGCELLTRKMELDIIGHNNSCNEININGRLVCLGIAGTVMAATAIISGSIMIAGNTIHWIEKKGKCDDSASSSAAEPQNKALSEYNAQPGDNLQ